MARKKSFRRYQQARRREWLLDTLTEIARLEGRLGLLTDQGQADFYGAEYLDPDQKLAKLLDAAAEAGV
jgi:hypothetical protein